VKFEIIQTAPISLIDTFINENKESISIPTIICTHPILSLPEVKVSVSKNPEGYFLYSDSSPITSTIYTSGKYERPSSSYIFLPHIYLPYPYDHFPKLRSYHPEIVKSSSRLEFLSF
jgi:hypothetical protein